MRKLPGYKPPKAEVGPDGEPIAPADTQSVREPTLPEFESDLCLITKDTTDAWRQQQIAEITSIRDYLARAQRNDDKGGAAINIPMMKTFERAILLPVEI